MSKNIFDGAHQWKEEDVNTVGLPRPFAIPNRWNLAKKVPIPWQSKDKFKSTGKLGLNESNESLVFDNNLCPFCGIKIEDNEIVYRWITAPAEISMPDASTRIVYSDYFPFHEECMYQARTFCPRIRLLKDSDFEIGLFSKLKENAFKDRLRSRKYRVK